MSKKDKYLKKITEMVTAHTDIDPPTIFKKLLEYYRDRLPRYTQRDLAIKLLLNNEINLNKAFGEIAASHKIKPINNGGDLHGLLQAFMERYPNYELSKTYPQLFTDLKLYCPLAPVSLLPSLANSNYANNASAAQQAIFNAAAPPLDDAKDFKQSFQNLRASQAAKLGWVELAEPYSIHDKTLLDLQTRDRYGYVPTSLPLYFTKPNIAVVDDFFHVQAHLKLHAEGLVKIYLKQVEHEEKYYSFLKSVDRQSAAVDAVDMPNFMPSYDGAKPTGKLPTSQQEYNDLKNFSVFHSAKSSQFDPPSWDQWPLHQALQTLLTLINEVGEFGKPVDDKAACVIPVDKLCSWHSSFWGETYKFIAPPNIVCYWLSKLIEKNLLPTQGEREKAIEIANYIFNTPINQLSEPLALIMSYHILVALGQAPEHTLLEKHLVRLYEIRSKRNQQNEKSAAAAVAPIPAEYPELEWLRAMQHPPQFTDMGGHVLADAKSADVMNAAAGPSAPPQGEVMGDDPVMSYSNKTVAASAGDAPFAVASASTTGKLFSKLQAAAQIVASAPAEEPSPADVKKTVPVPIIEVLIQTIKTETSINVDLDPMFDKFCCPISGAIMRDPATITLPGDENFEGDTFEYGKIRAHFDLRKAAQLTITHPLSNVDLPSRVEFVRNRHLRIQISDELTKFRDEKRAEKNKVAVSPSVSGSGSGSGSGSTGTAVTTVITAPTNAPATDSPPPVAGLAATAKPIVSNAQTNLMLS